MKTYQSASMRRLIGETEGRWPSSTHDAVTHVIGPSAIVERALSIFTGAKRFLGGEYVEGNDMHALRSSAVLVVSIVALVVSALSLPASAQEDTTPPQLVSFTLSANTADTSASDSPPIIMTAVITDDLSGVDEGGVYICMTYWDTCYAADFMGGDTYTQSIYYPQYSGSAVDRAFSVEFSDNVGHDVYLSPRSLLERGINLAVALNAVSPSYSRTITLMLNRVRAHGYVDAVDESSCWFDVPVLLQRKSLSGWKAVGEGYTNGNGSFTFPIHKKGKYRVTAAEIGLGTPAVTTCLKASKTATRK